MTKKKKRNVVIIVFSVILLLIIGGYAVYGLTLINPNSTKSIISHLTVDKDNPPEILATDSLDDYVCMLYYDKSFGNITLARTVLVKNKFYPNRYSIAAEGHITSWGEDYGLFLQNTPYNVEIEDTNKVKVYYYVYGFTSSEIPYNIVYTDADGNEEVIFSSTAYADSGVYLEMFSIEVESEDAASYDLNTEIVF